MLEELESLGLAPSSIRMLGAIETTELAARFLERLLGESSVEFGRDDGPTIERRLAPLVDRLADRRVVLLPLHHGRQGSAAYVFAASVLGQWEHFATPETDLAITEDDATSGLLIERNYRSGGYDYELRSWGDFCV